MAFKKNVGVVMLLEGGGMVRMLCQTCPQNLDEVFPVEVDGMVNGRVDGRVSEVWVE